VEGNSNHLKAVFLGSRQERTPLGSRRSEFGGETTLASTIVRNDTKDKFNFLANSGALEDFSGVIESDQADTLAYSLQKVGTGFAGVGVDNIRLAGKILGDFFDQADFVTGSAVKVATQDRKSLHDDWVRVAFDGIEWFYAGKVFAP
jgi:hypothetical protein